MNKDCFVGQHNVNEVFENPSALKSLPIEALPVLCKCIRQRLIQHAQTYGGHFASSMGVVELATALHYCFDFPFDRLIWDTGHQSAPHKLLTGRAAKFSTIRQLGGLHPFCSHKESVYDFGISGHAGNSLSLLMGAQWTETTSSKQPWTIAVIGDGAMESGLALEAFDKLHQMKERALIIVNYNGYSISPSVGGIAKILADIFKNPYISGAVARKKLGIFAPFKTDIVREGHNLSILTKLFYSLKITNEPKIIFIQTRKGEGYASALESPERYHAFPQKKDSEDDSVQYSELFGDWVFKKAKKESSLRVICAAMTLGSGLKRFSEELSSQFLDVGIAESHALACASGIALSGQKAIVSIYSTFLQRAYDQIIHDLALPRLPVILAIDRAGLVGGDGETHHGIYDLAFLNTIPNIYIFTPSTKEHFHATLECAYKADNGPLAIRYPKKKALSCSNFSQIFNCENLQSDKDLFLPDDLGAQLPWHVYTMKSKKQKKGLFLNFGTLLPVALRVIQKCELTLLDLPMARPLPDRLLMKWATQFSHWISLEEGVLSGGIGSQLAHLICSRGLSIRLLTLGISNSFIPHGSVEDLLSQCGLTQERMIEQVFNFIGR